MLWVCETRVNGRPTKQALTRCGFQVTGNMSMHNFSQCLQWLWIGDGANANWINDLTTWKWIPEWAIRAVPPVLTRTDGMHWVNSYYAPIYHFGEFCLIRAFYWSPKNYVHVNILAMCHSFSALLSLIARSRCESLIILRYHSRIRPSFCRNCGKHASLFYNESQLFSANFYLMYLYLNLSIFLHVAIIDQPNVWTLITGRSW